MTTGSKLIFAKLLTLSLMPNFLQSCGMLASQVASGISLKPTLPTDNNVSLLTTVSQSGAQSPQGCPMQGSILGPLFYINDLSFVSSFSTPLLFADGTKCCARIMSLSDTSCLQDDLDLVYNWSAHSGLSFNVSKCCLLRLYNMSVSPVNMPPIILANQKFLFLTTVKILVSYFLQTFPGRSITTTFQLRPTNNTD